MAGAGPGQGAEDRPPEADLHRRPHPGVRPPREALGLNVLALSLPGLDREGQRAAISAALLEEYGALARLCPQCGSTAHGRPRLPEHRDLHLSLSYADGLAVAVVAPVPVGVDVELDGPAPDGFSSMGAWTAYEAVAKLTGEGVRRDAALAPPPGISVTPLAGLPAGYLGSLAASNRRSVTVESSMDSGRDVDPLRRRVID